MEGADGFDAGVVGFKGVCEGDFSVAAVVGAGGLVHVDRAGGDPVVGVENACGLGSSAVQRHEPRRKVSNVRCG